MEIQDQVRKIRERPLPIESNFFIRHNKQKLASATQFAIGLLKRAQWTTRMFDHVARDDEVERVILDSIHRFQIGLQLRRDDGQVSEILSRLKLRHGVPVGVADANACGNRERRAPGAELHALAGEPRRETLEHFGARHYGLFSLIRELRAARRCASRNTR